MRAALAWGLVVLLAGCAAPTASPPTPARAAPAPVAPREPVRPAAALPSPATSVPAQTSPLPAVPVDVPDTLQEFERGLASWYGRRFHGRRTASGERFDMRALTAAHRSLPIGALVRVRHAGSGREVEVRINDRGPHVRGRIIDLSLAAAEALDLHGDGVQQVVLFASSEAIVQAEAAKASAAPPRAGKARKPVRRRTP